MIELPEAANIAHQLNETILGKKVAGVTAGQTPHKLAWYYGDKLKYGDLLEGRTISKAAAFGGLVEIEAENARILLGEGVNLRFHARGQARPTKHQLLIEFGDTSALSAAVQMYGGMGAFPVGELENKYYQVAKEKPSPLSAEFNRSYFEHLLEDDAVQKLSLKALLATEQRIPGLGNGVLQDILFNGQMHPKKKVTGLTSEARDRLYEALKTTLADMAQQGGRDTELDIFGRAGSYRTILCSKTAGKPCPRCGTPIVKEAYMGGSAYYCPQCQSG